MNSVNRTVLANLKQNKGKNLLTGIAIFLTTLLLFLITAISFGEIDLQFKAANTLYPTYHVMYRNVDENRQAELAAYEEVEQLGLRQDVAEAVMKDTGQSQTLIYLNETACQLMKIKPDEGNFPKGEYDIVISENLLAEYGPGKSVGDSITLPYQVIEENGIGYEESQEFQISGVFRNKGTKEEAAQASLVSKVFMEQKQPSDTRVYRAMCRLKLSNNTTTDAVEQWCTKLGGKLKIAEEDIVINKLYLMANYLDSAFTAGVAAVIAVVALAGILTICSIYYVSMIYKVQEFGKLKAIGATKRQIRQIVFREGLLTAFIAIPAGLLAGALLYDLVMGHLVNSYIVLDSMSEMMNRLFVQKKAGTLRLWYYLLAGGVSLLTTVFAMVHPMNKAAKISPVEAMKYNGTIKTRKKQRGGFSEITLARLTMANLSRNKKRTAITIITLGISGILFMVISTVLSCSDPKEKARDAVLQDIMISVNNVHGDKMRPYLEWSELMQNNPLNEELYQKLERLPGLESITKQNKLEVYLEDLLDGNEMWRTRIAGFPKEYEKMVQDSIYEGVCSNEDMLAGDKIIMSHSMQYWAPDFKLGDTVRMQITNGSQVIKKEFQVAAIADFPKGLDHYAGFMLPNEVIQTLTEFQADSEWYVEVEDGKEKEAEELIQGMIEGTDSLNMTAYGERLEEEIKQTNLLSQICYTFLGVIGGIGIMTLINTMINSIYIRRKELGLLQAVGLSERQTMKMLQMEGLVYTAGTLILALGIGSLGGYGLYFYGRKEQIMGMVSYHYPWMQSLILAGIVLGVQVLLTYLTARSFRRYSLIEKIKLEE